MEDIMRKVGEECRHRKIARKHRTSIHTQTALLVAVTGIASFPASGANVSSITTYAPGTWTDPAIWSNTPSSFAYPDNNATTTFDATLSPGASITLNSAVAIQKLT